MDGKVLLDSIPDRLEEWGKVEWMDGGDTIHASDVTQSTGRDTSFIRVWNHLLYVCLSNLLQCELMVDKYAHCKNILPEYEHHAYYGQLRSLLVFPAPPRLLCKLNIATSKIFVFAVVAECDQVSKPNRVGVRCYRSLKGTTLTDLNCVECVVTQVHHISKCWGLVDRSNTLSQILFTDGPVDNGADDDLH